jgi:hypothetical protein
MTHYQKLDRILNGLLSRKLKRLAENTDDKRLTFDFLCNVLLKDEDVDTGEKEFIKDRLMFDGYITFITVDEIELPDITQAGIKFLQQGGYVKRQDLLNLDNEIKQESQPTIGTPCEVPVPRKVRFIAYKNRALRSAPVIS